MGKQSARLYYQGKDHKDIFFQGKYHDAMYVGSKLVWHKIKKEGYFSIIICDPYKDKTSGLDKTLILIFDEKTNKFEFIKLIYHGVIDGSVIHYGSSCVVCDSEQIFISNQGNENIIAVSIDGINFGDTGLDFDDNSSFMLKRYCYMDYVWDYSFLNGFVIFKQSIKYDNGKYIIDGSMYNTSLPKHYSSSEDPYDGSSITREKDLLTLHNKNYNTIVHYNEESIIKVGGMASANCIFTACNIENKTKEMIEEVTGFAVGHSELFSINSCEFFFTIVTERISGDNWKNFIFNRYLYVYYSKDGTKFFRKLVLTQNSTKNIGFFLPTEVAYRNDRYYFYMMDFTGEIGINFVIITKDFEHFSKLQINKEIEINGIVFETKYLHVLDEKGGIDLNVQYFFNGDRNYPFNGMICTDENKEYILYIDNMYFENSSSNMIYKLSKE